jgi:hypothetical protein
VVDGSSSNEAVNLRDLFLAFAEKLLASARSHIDAHGMPKRHEHAFRFQAAPKSSSGSITVFGTIEKPDYASLLFINWQFWAIEEAECCAREHFEQGVRRVRQSSDDDSKAIATPIFGPLRDGLGRQLTYELYWAVAQLCERYQTLDLTEEQLLGAYKLLTEEWTSPTVVWDLSAPLVNFKCEKFPLLVGSGVELAALSPEEKTTLWNPNGAGRPFGEPQGLDRGDMARAQFVLRDSSTTARDGQGFGPEFRSEVIRVLTALRLLKSGDIGVPAILGVSKGLFERTASQYVFDGRARNSGRTYELSSGDWDASRKIYDALRAIDDKMQIPLRRFNQAYGRQSGEDTIIDLTIALESCLLPNTRDELQYRLSTRGAALLAGLRKPVETQTLLKTMYGIRSEIVHNGKLLSENGVRKKIESLGPIVAKDFLHACEDVVRDVLRESILRLATGGTLSALSQELDAKVLSGLLPLA